MLRTAPKQSAQTYAVLGGRVIWRRLMPKTRHHIYFGIDEGAGVVEVLTVWTRREVRIQTSRFRRRRIAFASTHTVEELERKDRALLRPSIQRKNSSQGLRRASTCSKTITSMRRISTRLKPPLS